MSGTFSLQKHIAVSPRFTRSVALSRDAESLSALVGYTASFVLAHYVVT